MAESEVEVAQIRQLLRRAKPPADPLLLDQLLVTMLKLGPEVAELIPEVVIAINRGYEFSSSALVPVVAKHKSEVMLGAVLNKYGPKYLDISSKCQLFSAGFGQFQPDLLDYLRVSYDQYTDHLRSMIVVALGNSGTASVLQDLQDIRGLTSHRLSELESEDTQLSGMDQEIRSLHARCRRAFLRRLDEVVEIVKSRAECEPTSGD